MMARALILDHVAVGIGGVGANHVAVGVLGQAAHAGAHAQVHAVVGHLLLHGREEALTGGAVGVHVVKAVLGTVAAGLVHLEVGRVELLGGGVLHAVVDEPLHVVGRVAHHVADEHLVHGVGLRLGLEGHHLAQGDVGRVGVQAKGVGALDAQAVAAQEGLALRQDDLVAVLGRLHRGAGAREAAAHHEHVAGELLGDLALPVVPGAGGHLVHHVVGRGVGKGKGRGHGGQNGCGAGAQDKVLTGQSGRSCHGFSPLASGAGPVPAHLCGCRACGAWGRPPCPA